MNQQPRNGCNTVRLALLEECTKLETVQLWLYNCCTKEYVAYQGQAYQIEWYYDTKGESQALEYYQALPSADRRKVLRLFQLMGEIGQIRDKTKFRNEGDKVYAFKPQPHRFLCFFLEGKKIIISNAFVKKQQKLPKNEKDRALRMMMNYQQRVKKDIYYEQEE